MAWDAFEGCSDPAAVVLVVTNATLPRTSPKETGDRGLIEVVASYPHPRTCAQAETVPRGA
jgi:hypothetical protein